VIDNTAHCSTPSCWPRSMPSWSANAKRRCSLSRSRQVRLTFGPSSECDPGPCLRRDRGGSQRASGVRAHARQRRGLALSL
jgi:hypothetical protein